MRVERDHIVLSSRHLRGARAPDRKDIKPSGAAHATRASCDRPTSKARHRAASLDGLEDKPKAPICAAQMITIEDPVPVLNHVLVEEIEMRDEAKFQIEEPKLLDIKDKVQTDTALKDGASNEARASPRAPERRGEPISDTWP